MALEAKLNLAELQQAFARWRQTRRPRQIPPELGANAVALLDQHRVSEIMRTLGVDHRTLRRWKRHYQACSEVSGPQAPAFVALPPAVAEVPPPNETLALKLTHHGYEGQAVTLEGQLNWRQWHAALRWLRGEEVAR